MHNRLSPPPLILLYHRVTALQTDPQQLAVTPAHFAEHLDALKQHAVVLTLADLLKWLPTGRWPRRAVVLTFDDGYADNLHEALPLLQKRSLPATIYLTADAIGRPTEFFWDELDRILLQPGWLPRSLQLEIGGRIFQWDIRPLEHYTPEEAQPHRAWNVLQPGPTVRHTVYRTLCDFLRKLPPKRQRAAMDRIRDWAGVEPAARPTHRTLTKEEAMELAHAPGIEIGAHTMHHPMLAHLPPPEQSHEIRQSRAALEALTGHPIRSFSYPYGAGDTFTPETVSAVRDAGFSSAATTIPASIQRHGDPFQLPRCIVRDWDGDTFQRQLRNWFVYG